MELLDTKISEAIIESYMKKLLGAVHSDAIIIGGGPSGLVCAKILAENGFKTTVLEKHLHTGGGMWGGGMMFNQILVQDSAIDLLDSYGIRYEKFKDDLYTVDSIECISMLNVKAIQAGATILNNVGLEDLIVKNNEIKGIVINWGHIIKEKLMVDPIMIESKTVLDATGHDAVAINKLVERLGNVLETETGGLIGEKPMSAEQGEEQVIENTKEAFPNLFVSGMAANATFGGQRMGPIFGGMILSGKKVAEQMMAKMR